MELTLMFAYSCTESFPPSSSFIQASQSFGFAPKFFLFGTPGVSPGCWKISPSCSCRPMRYRLRSKNDRRTMAVETTKSKKSVERNVNLQNVSSNRSFGGLLARVTGRRTDRARTTLAGRPSPPSCLPGRYCLEEERKRKRGLESRLGSRLGSCG